MVSRAGASSASTKARSTVSPCAAGHGEGEAVIEPDVAEEVADFVVVEGDLAAAVVAGGDEDAGLVVGWSAPYGEVFDCDEAAGVELLVELRCTEAEAVPGPDFKVVVLALLAFSAADGHDGGLRVRLAGVNALAHLEREELEFLVGAGQDDAGFVGVAGDVFVPVVDEFVDGGLGSGAEVKPSAPVAGVDRVLRVSVLEVLGNADLPRHEVGGAVAVFDFGEDARSLCRGESGGGGYCLVGVEAVNVAQHVFGVGELASDGVDAVASHDVVNEAEAGSGFDRLLLLGIAEQYDLGAVFPRRA